MPATLAGVALGAVVYYGFALLPLLFGDQGWIISSAAVGASTGWAARVLSHPINLFSLVAFGVALALLADRYLYLRRQEHAFRLNVLDGDSQTLILPDDALVLHRRLGQLHVAERSLVALEVLQAGLQRARANWSAQDVADAVKTQSELEQGSAEADYSTVRYLVWAIPSLGFIGTVLGIGQAMGHLRGGEDADRMLELATGHLSTAFDTTLVALVLSLISMYILHRVQSLEDSLLVRATDWCMRGFVFRMHIPRS